MTLNFIHSDKYADAIKVASKFTGKHSHRAILFFVNHKSDGSIEVTDSHKFLQIKGVHGFETDYLVHPKTLEFATGQFPDISRNIGEPNQPTIIELDNEQIGIWLQMHRSINQLSKQYDKRNGIVKFNAKINVELEIGDENNVCVNLPYKKITETKVDESVDRNVFNYNPELMRDCLEAHVVMGTEKLQIFISGKMRPVILSGDDNKVVSGLVPIRTY